MKREKYWSHSTPYTRKNNDFKSRAVMNTTFTSIENTSIDSSIFLKKTNTKRERIKENPIK